MITNVGELIQKLETLDPNRKIVIETTKQDWRGVNVSTKEIVRVEERDEDDCYILIAR